ncbi:GH-E family nuclease [Psychrobacillus sp. FSL W7-1457]|uniref:GH-E family nuclease n=1 Tax=Psychrobacillus sp. FSL W7-1457 TaxID=2954547 RepID=UPI00315ACA35
MNVKKVADEYGSVSEESVIEGTYYTLPDGKIIRQYYGRTGAQQYKYVQSIPKERIGSGKTLEDIFPPITKTEEFLIGDIIAMSEDPSSESVAEAALFTVFKPLKMVDKIIDSIKDGEKKIEKIEDKSPGKAEKKEKTKSAKRLREHYLGRTPSKKSRTGSEVIERMKNENPPKIRTTRGGKTEFKDNEGEWHDISEADMAHITDAVSWWNEVGRHYGPKSKEVREWMLNSDNYVLDHYSLNRSVGAKLGETYLPPKK